MKHKWSKVVRKSVVGAIALMVGIFAFADECGAQLEWRQVASTGPSERRDHAMAYDSGRRKVVLFGGYGNSPTIKGDTWEWDGSSWSQVAATGPSARNNHAMTYDSAGGEVLLFGGGNNLGDTWVWDGISWTQITVSGPSGRKLHAMVYDNLRSRVLLFGGYEVGGINNDTWQWDGASWSQVATSGPYRGDHSMAYDVNRDKVVLFGVDNGSDHTWEWNGTSWTQAFSTGPIGRQYHSMDFHSAMNKVILFGGRTSPGSSLQNDTWEWNGVTWIQIPVVGPSARYRHATAFDGDRRRIVLFGGENGNYLKDTWEFGDWSTPTSSPTPSPTRTPTFTPTTTPTSTPTPFGSLSIASIESKAFPFISIFFAVRDGQNRSVNGLTGVDFEATENSIFQAAKVEELICTSQSIFDIVLVIDHSDSINQAFPYIQDGTSQLILQAAPQDRFSLVAFGDTVDVNYCLASDRVLLINEIQNLPLEGDTALYDAVWKSIECVRGTSNNQAVIVLTDGRDNRSVLHPDVNAVIAFAQAEQVQLYTIAVDAGFARPDPYILGRMANETGGTYTLVDRTQYTQIPAIYQNLYRLFKSLYLASYETINPNPGGFRQVNIRRIVGGATDGESYYAFEPCFLDLNFYEQGSLGTLSLGNSDIAGQRFFNPGKVGAYPDVRADIFIENETPTWVRTSLWSDLNLPFSKTPDQLLAPADENYVFVDCPSWVSFNFNKQPISWARRQYYWLMVEQVQQNPTEIRTSIPRDPAATGGLITGTAQGGTPFWNPYRHDEALWFRMYVCSERSTPTPTATPSPTSTLTPAPTATASLTPTFTPTVTPTYPKNPPFVQVAGYLSADLNPGHSGTLNIFAYATDPDGQDISRVELFYQGSAIGILLADTGNGVFQFVQGLPASSPVQALLELKAWDDGSMGSTLWPYLTVQ